MKKILLNILTHGNEFVGVKVADQIKNLHLELIGNGLDIQIANEQAYTEKKRFIDHDLNRVFPGNPKGSYEEKRAHELAPVIFTYDLVIDVHSTESGSGDMVIVTKMDTVTKAVLQSLSPKYVLFMNMIPDRSLISQAKIGIAFEMGSERDISTVDKTLNGVEFLLSYMGLIQTKKSLGFVTEYFEVFSQVSKPLGALLEDHVKNFTMIKAGEVFARKSDGTPIVAESDFYPVIFGSMNYKTIFGFMARKIVI